MQYKEYMLIYLTLISGLACTNLLHGVGLIIKRWSVTHIGPEYLLALGLNFFSIVDYWFHSFYFPYTYAEDSIFVFFLFLIPSSMLFFSTIVLFPTSASNTDDYVHFFKQNLRSNTLINIFFVVSVSAKIYVANFIIEVLLWPLFVTLFAFLGIYLLNSVRIYKLVVSLILIMHTARWIYQGIL